MKKVIVTGATGQDGSYMIEYLLKNTDNTVIAAVRRTSQAILSNLKDVIGNPRLKLVTTDLNDVHSVTSLIRDEKPDYFVNFGASAFVPDSWNSPAQVMQTNSVALIHILEAIRQFAPQCRTYSAGSSEQWGNVLYSPQDEKHPPRPRSIYGVSKVAAGMICKVYRESYGLYVVHGILLNHESERRQDYYVSRKVTKGVARIAKAINEGKLFEPIELGNLDAKRDWSHAEDFVDGVWRMMNQVEFNCRHLRAQGILIDYEPNPPLNEYVLASGETHSIRELVEKAFASAGIRGLWAGESGPDETYAYLPPVSLERLSQGMGVPPLVRINPVFYRPADVELLLGDSTAARTELGWSPQVSFDDLVKRMVKSDLAAVGL